MAFQTAYLFNVSHNWAFYGFVFCGTVCSYNFHWALTPKLFQNPTTPTSALSQIPLWLHIVLVATALMGAGVLFVILRPHWFWLAGAGFLSFLYSAPKIPLPVTRFLRKIAYGKTIFLTLAWTYITAVLPLLITDTKIDTPHILFCVNRFFLIYSICILFDLRDRESDQKEGIRGMITQFNLKAVDRIYFGSLFVFFSSALALAFFFPIPVILAFSIPGLVLLFYYNWFKKQASDFVYNFILDGFMIISLPLLLLFEI